ncbi:MAG: hypothetical protein C0410_07470 [Anaerolinea sp.]|nr:hypothetical protein [Anaerolinea sp.]
MNSLLSYIKADLLAFVVLVVLIFCIFSSFVFIAKPDRATSKSSYYSILMMLFPLVGFPAALDLMTTKGYTKYFAVIAFIILLIPVIVSLTGLVKTRTFKLTGKTLNWLTIPFVIGGLIVSGYLTYVELTSSTAVCGVAIPGCGEVQNSPYAVLFGFLPVALLGVIGYIGIFISWLGKRVLPSKNKKLLSLIMWGMCFFGILFSTYLTYLEVFVLRATCSWCILAAVFMNMLFWVSIQDAQEYFLRDQDEEELA